MFSAFVKVA